MLSPQLQDVPGAQHQQAIVRWNMAENLPGLLLAQFGKQILRRVPPAYSRRRLRPVNSGTRRVRHAARMVRGYETEGDAPPLGSYPLQSTGKGTHQLLSRCK